jgi:hypothetical protein
MHTHLLPSALKYVCAHRQFGHICNTQEAQNARVSADDQKYQARIESTRLRYDYFDTVVAADLRGCFSSTGVKEGNTAPFIAPNTPHHTTPHHTTPHHTTTQNTRASFKKQDNGISTQYSILKSKNEHI